ncbi:cell division protein ZapA [Compostibacter hankyongensis]|uniref:Cell division protein ZapA n=1 Tax=Compostibacter hankyongensis TaxID=1007089 RepID=A0ABP8G9N8_9BACT
MDTLIPINVVIADRSYRLKIKAEEEEQVRKTIREVNEKILEFKTAYAGKDIQDYIAMCLILYATQPATGANAALPADLQTRLESLEKLLEQAG